jgi:AraC-like DNA-binding protein
MLSQRLARSSVLQPQTAGQVAFDDMISHLVAFFREPWRGCDDLFQTDWPQYRCGGPLEKRRGTVLGRSADDMVDSAGAGQRDATGPGRGGAQVEVLSTDAVPSRERLSYWREVVCTPARGFYGTLTEAAPGEFSARAAVRSCGPFRLMVVEPKIPYQVVRTRQDLANAPWDHYSVFLQLRGKTISTREGEEPLQLCAGDIALCAPRVYRTDHSGGAAIVKLPRAMIERRAPWVLDRPQRKLASTARFANHLKLHVLELANGSPPLGEAQTSLLVDSLCNLVALAAAGDIAATRLQSELQLEALLAYCRDNLHDPDLSPQRAADYIGISVRTLHSRFQQIDQTFGRWVLENRLEGCGIALCDPKQRLLNISEIAYRWGFNDLSYFNRAFRAHFDMCPGEWRNAPQGSC